MDWLNNESDVLAHIEDEIRSNEMINIPFDEKFSENMDRTNSHGDNPCIICGRKCRTLDNLVHVHGGFSTIVTEEEAKKLNVTDGGADMGMFPIGPDCLKKHPELRTYVQVQGVTSKPRKAAKQTARKVDWDIYADLYRQVFGESASDREIAQDIRKRQGILSGAK